MWNDVDFERGSIAIRATLRDNSGKLSITQPKAKSFRRIELSAEAMEALERHRAAMEAETHRSPYVFVTPVGGFVRLGPFSKNEFRPLLKRAELPPIRLYDLRHSAVSRSRPRASTRGSRPTWPGTARPASRSTRTATRPTIQREGVGPRPYSARRQRRPANREKRKRPLVRLRLYWRPYSQKKDAPLRT
jgi:hypothetical protein